MQKRTKMRLPLSEQFREAVRNCGISPAEISRRTGISPAMLSQFLGGSKFLGTKNMDTLADLLDLELGKREH